jgi:transposase
MEDPEFLSFWLQLYATLNEKQRRHAAAIKSLEFGPGGIKRVHELTGLSRTTIIKGIHELQQPAFPHGAGTVRKPGGGRKPIVMADPALILDLERLLDENTAGDPMSLLKWTSKSCRGLAQELSKSGHRISAMSVCRLLHDLDYSLQGTRKELEGEQHPDRDAQCRYINTQVKQFFKTGAPVISVDTKKRELIGDFKNPGKTWRKKGQPEPVNVYDFPDLAAGVAILYGTYDVNRNAGMVHVGVSHDTAEFAVESIYQWWQRIGKCHYSQADRILICADGGGSNGSRNRIWKVRLQEVANATGLQITVCHYPPGTSKWNKIEHRMFSFISVNWRGKPLVSYDTVLNLISATKTKTGLQIKVRLDPRVYQIGVEVSEKEFKKLEIVHHKSFPKWNYTIKPQTSR